MWASKDEQIAALEADNKSLREMLHKATDQLHLGESVGEQRAVAFMRLRLDETYGKVKGGGTDG